MLSPNDSCDTPICNDRKRDSMAREPVLPAAAYAVPFALNMAARGGSPMRTMDPARPPRKNIRRESGIFMSLIQRFRYGHYKFPKAELRTPKALVRLLDGSLIPRLLRAPIGVPEQLFHNALLADRLSR